MAGCGCGGEITISDQAQRKVLWALLAINALMFCVELLAGVLAESTGLIADSLDMLADAGVYGIALYAVGRSARGKRHAAMTSGVLQMLLALLVLGDVARRFMLGSAPVSGLMMSIAALALVANLTCLLLLAKHRNGEVHMRASWIFSTNDVLANLGVILAGALVYVLGASWPDLVIGLAIAVLVFYGGIRIVRDTRQERAGT